MMHLILGGARSGKSRYAESKVLTTVGDGIPVYFATAVAKDEEMADRIIRHQADRSGRLWHLVECPINIENELLHVADNSVVLIDCLTLWLTNVIMETIDVEKSIDEHSAIISARVEQLLKFLTLHKQRITLVMVSNEVGSGIVPMGEQSRLFVDHAGWFNQKLAALCEQVTLVTAGLPMVLKGASDA